MNEQVRPPETAKIDTESLANQLVNVSEVHLNVSQEIIITTEDKIRICLSEHLKRLERKRGWIAPLGITATIIVLIVTSTFKNIVFDAATWQAMFIIA